MTYHSLKVVIFIQWQYTVAVQSNKQDVAKYYILSEHHREVTMNFKNGRTSEEWSPSSNIFSKSKSTLIFKALWEAYNQLFPAQIMPRAYKVGFILYYWDFAFCTRGFCCRYITAVLNRISV